MPQQDRDEYIHGHHESVLRIHSWRTVENSAAYLIPHLRPGLDVLDVGSGPGTISTDLAARVTPGRVIGIDASAEVVASSAAAYAKVENLKFSVGNAYAIDAAAESFDVVHAHQVLQHLGRPIDALREFYRVLRPGGIVAARDVDYGGVIWSPESVGLERWLSLNGDVHVWNGGDPHAGRLLKSWAHTAGFTEVAASGSAWVFSSAAEREWWGGAWSERATKSQFAAHAIESGYSNTSELETISAAWKAWTEDPEGWFLMPHGEIIARKPS